MSLCHKVYFNVNTNKELDFKELILLVVFFKEIQTGIKRFYTHIFIFVQNTAITLSNFAVDSFDNLPGKIAHTKLEKAYSFPIAFSMNASGMEEFTPAYYFSRRPWISRKYLAWKLYHLREMISVRMEHLNPIRSACVYNIFRFYNIISFTPYGLLE